MSSFSEANQTRLSLKIKLSHFAWYSSSAVISMGDSFGVLVLVKILDNQVRKIVPPVINETEVRLELDHKIHKKPNV